MYFKWCFNLLLSIIFIIWGCSEKPNTTQQDNITHTCHSKIKYAKHFDIQEKNGKKIICITENFKDTMYFEVNQKFKRLAILGTIPAFQIILLQHLQDIVAIDDIKYYCHPDIKLKFQSHQIEEILPNLQWNYEKLIQVHPDLLIHYSNLNNHVQLRDILQQHHIQWLMYLDYLESHPLGRAEWIKVLACLINEDAKAEKIFSDIERTYHHLKKCVDTCLNRPKVLTEVMYGDVWYIAGNQSYIAQLIRDAGGKYAFDFHEYSNAKPYSIEYVLKYAQDADVWIHLHQFKTLVEMTHNNMRYTLFKAFQNKRCYNNNKIINEYGYNDFYESGICMPHLILRDLIAILHPNCLPANYSFQYYYLLPEK